jgi:hypothetical protein
MSCSEGPTGSPACLWKLQDGTVSSAYNNVHDDSCSRPFHGMAAPVRSYWTAIMQKQEQANETHGGMSSSRGGGRERRATVQSEEQRRLVRRLTSKLVPS